MQPALGTNPISLAVPAKDNDSFVLDMATTTVALGKVSLFYISSTFKTSIHIKASYQIFKVSPWLF